jgi:hypothetical protein
MAVDELKLDGPNVTARALGNVRVEDHERFRRTFSIGHQFSVGRGLDPIVAPPQILLHDAAESLE